MADVTDNHDLGMQLMDTLNGYTRIIRIRIYVYIHMCRYIFICTHGKKKKNIYIHMEHNVHLSSETCLDVSEVAG